MKNLYFFFLVMCYQAEAQMVFPKGDVYEHHSGKKIRIPNRSIAFIDAVDSLSSPIQNNIVGIIGEPNFNPNRKLDTSLTLTQNQSIIVRFTNNKIKNIKGKDLCVFNIGKMKKLELLLEIRKGVWQSIGFVSNENPVLYLDDSIAKNTSYVRLKLKNVTQNSVVIDAIAAIGKSNERELKKFVMDGKRIDVSNNYITLKFKDYRQWDGDRIRITVNGETVIKSAFLAVWWKKIKIALKEGENSINIVALNDGLMYPNTTRIRIFDGEKRYDSLLKLRRKTRKTIFVDK